MTTTNRIIVKGLWLALILSGTAAVQGQMPKTTTHRIPGAATTRTEQLRGMVEYVEGNTLVVKMASGGIRTFTPPESRRFIIDGKELTLRELKPGTKLTATVVTTTTPVTERTTTVGTGTVWFVSGRNVILTLPNGENRQYTVKDDYKFNIAGNKNATVFDLRKGMIVSAEKIVETPHVEIANDTQVAGTAPAPKVEVVAKAAPASRPAAPQPNASRSAEPEPTPRAAQPAPAAVEQAAAPMPKKLPKTGSPLPLIGLMGLLCGGASLFVRKLR